MAGPLDGYRVLDLSRILAGPYCAMLLGDLGADVIKVERPEVGDDTRRWGPPFLGGESAYYLCANRNKRSVTLNLQSKIGQELVRQLAGKCDVVVENFKTGEMDSFGLGYEALSREHPGLIYCSITGYGQTGPDKDLPGYDFIIQGRGGVMGITGEPDGEPMKVGVAVTDVTAGLFAANAIQAALLGRVRTGRGQAIDISLLDVQVAWLANVASNHLISGNAPKRYGNAHPSIVPYQSFRAADGPFCLAVGNDAQWGRLCSELGRPKFANDKRFDTNPSRVQNREAVVSILESIFRTRDRAYWLSRLRSAGVPCGPIQSVDQVFNDDQVLAREMLVSVSHPTAGQLPVVGSPFKFSESRFESRLAPPLLGQHTDEILMELLECSREEIGKYRDDGAI